MNLLRKSLEAAISSAAALIVSASLAGPLLLPSTLSAATPAAQPAVTKATPRIAGDIASSARVSLPGSRNPRTLASEDLGRVAPATPLQGMTLAFARSDAQEKALLTLIAAQQDRSSPLYHQWLTPEQFGARFGVADADLAKAQAWLQSQGFSIDRIARARNRIFFSGTAAQAESAFGTELHQYRAPASAGTAATAETHMAPNSELTLPSALASVVSSVGNLSTFRLKPRFLRRPASPRYTYGPGTGEHLVTPLDVATIYDIDAAYSAGYTGAGQSITIVGQSAISLTDITDFQAASTVTGQTPTLVLEPGTGTSVASEGDESESDLDVEYSGAIAKGANIFFVYTGNNPDYGVFDALQYAIDERTSPIVSISYGTCETGLALTDYNTFNAILEQGSTQGQSIVSASGDTGSEDCFNETGLTAAQTIAVSADFPSTSPYVTSVGGTEFPAADVADGTNPYWNSDGTNILVGSAKSYIPEQVWNDSTASTVAQYGLSAGGGGTSVFAPRPTWQAGVPGIPSGSFRLTPDVSLDASPNNAGYLYCSSDSSDEVTSPCSTGFLSPNGDVEIAGGTSFAAPIFAGMLAIINQARNSTGGGVANPTLYSLASNATTYASAFHDITSGNNKCNVGIAYCSTAGESEYAATTGYDEASGLGSVDLNNLLTAWPTTTVSSLTSTTTTLAAAAAAPASGVADVITITVAASGTLTTAPTGTVSVSVDGTTVTPALTLTAGVATYTFSSTTTGAHTITATYSGDSTYAASTGTLSLNVGGTTTTTGTFTLSATNITVTDGSSGNSTLTITPAGGYTGTLQFDSAISTDPGNTCYSINDNNDVAVTGTAAVTTTYTIYTTAADCSTADLAHAHVHRFKTPAGTRKLRAANSVPAGLPADRRRSEAVGAALAGLLGLGFFARRRRAVTALLGLAFLGVLSLGVSGCSGNGGGVTATGTTTDATKGTYTISVTGTDESTLEAATTSFTLVIQ